MWQKRPTYVAEEIRNLIYHMAHETPNNMQRDLTDLPKETYCMAKETYYMAKET